MPSFRKCPYPHPPTISLIPFNPKSHFPLLSPVVVLLSIFLLSRPYVVTQSHYVMMYSFLILNYEVMELMIKPFYFHHSSNHSKHFVLMGEPVFLALNNVTISCPRVPLTKTNHKPMIACAVEITCSFRYIENAVKLIGMFSLTLTTEPTPFGIPFFHHTADICAVQTDRKRSLRCQVFCILRMALSPF